MPYIFIFSSSDSSSGKIGSLVECMTSMQEEVAASTTTSGKLNFESNENRFKVLVPCT